MISTAFMCTNTWIELSRSDLCCVKINCCCSDLNLFDDVFVLKYIRRWCSVTNSSEIDANRHQWWQIFWLAKMSNWNDSNLIELMKMCLDNELYFCLFGESYKTAILCQVLYWSHKISWEETFLCLHVCFLLYVLLQ